SPSHPTSQSPSRPTSQSPSHPTSQSPSHPTSQRWAADFKWPKEWSKETPTSDEGAEEKAPEKPASGTKTPESSADATEADPPIARVMTNSTAASPNSDEKPAEEGCGEVEGEDLATVSSSGLSSSDSPDSSNEQHAPPRGTSE